MTSRTDLPVASSTVPVPLVPERADGFVARLSGWLGRRRLDVDAAIWLYPCRAVHSIGMRVPIDVVFLDAEGMVLRIVPALPPWRAVGVRAARSVIELPAGAARRRGLVPGLRLPMPMPAPGVRPRGSARVVNLAVVAFTVACVVVGCPGGPAHAAAPLVEEAPAIGVGPVEIVFETEWTPDPRRLVEDPIPVASPPVPRLLPMRTASGFAGAGAGSAGASVTGAATAGAVASAPAGAAWPSEDAGRAMAVPAQLPAAGAACASALPALALTRPLAAETLARALEEADGLYHGKQWARAMEAFCGLVEVDPGNRMAWLRIGNLHHQRSRIAPATHAYRQAARPADAADGRAGAPEPTPVRARALANLAAVALELARDSLGELQTLNLPAQASAMQLAEQVTDEMRHLGAGASRASSSARGPVEMFGGRGGRLQPVSP
jgi:uncharacterized membrane protein (UPF0127 family)